MTTPISPTGLSLIKHYEGLGPEYAKTKRIVPYICPAGKRTIGYGHVIGPNEHFHELTLAQAEGLLAFDVARFAAALDKVITAPLRPHEREACISFAFNLGVSAFEHSTLLKLINGGFFIKAADEFPRWCKASVNGKLKTLDGLLFRRFTEHHYFLTGEIVYFMSRKQIDQILPLEKLHLKRLKPTIEVVAMAPVHLHSEAFAIA